VWGLFTTGVLGLTAGMAMAMPGLLLVGALAVASALLVYLFTGSARESAWAAGTQALFAWRYRRQRRVQFRSSSLTRAAPCSDAALIDFSLTGSVNAIDIGSLVCMGWVPPA